MFSSIHIRVAQLLSAVAVTIAVSVPTPGKEPTAGELSAEVDRLFARWDNPDSPGIAVGIVQGGELIHSRGYGMANLDHAFPIGGTTVFEVGSVTKSFTTACFAVLLDDGAVKLDDDVRKYIPELHAVDPPIRVRHLLRCESGLRDYYLSMQLAGWNVLDRWTDDDVLQLVAAQKRFDFPAGARFAYSNSDYFLLALIVKRASGKSLAEFAAKRLFRPLEMHHTFFADDQTIVVQGRATGYERKWRTGQYHILEQHSETIGPYGLKTTLEDLSRWDRNCRDNKLPSGPHFREFLSTGCLVGNRRCLESFPETCYRGAERDWYTGGVPGFMSQFVRFPKHDLAIILLCNISDRAEWIAMTDNAQRVADLYLADRLEAQMEATPSPEAPAVTVPIERLRKLVGTYRRTAGLEQGFVTRVDIQDKHLVFTDHFGRETPLEATGGALFRPSDSGADRTFKFSMKDGRATSLTISTGPQSSDHYEAFAVARPTPEQLAAYVGSFYCDELFTTYFISRQEVRLLLRVNNRPWEELEPTVQDEFVPKSRPTTDEGRVLRFSEQMDGKATQLHVRLWRGDAVFERVPSRLERE